MEETTLISVRIPDKTLSVIDKTARKQKCKRSIVLRSLVDEALTARTRPTPHGPSLKVTPPSSGEIKTEMDVLDGGKLWGKIVRIE